MMISAQKRKIISYKLHENFKTPRISKINFLNLLNIKFQKTKMEINKAVAGDMSMQFRMVLVCPLREGGLYD